MKKLLLISLVSILIIPLGSIASAQIGPVGIKAGMNLADLPGDFDNTNMRAGLVVGAWANINLGMFDIQPELLYSMKGAKLKGGIEVDHKYNYLEIPILVKYNLPFPGALKPNLYTGPSFSILMSAKANAGDGDADIKDYLKSVDYSIIFGAGVMMDMQAYVLTFDARYNLGLTDVNDSITDIYGDNPEIKNSVIMLMAGIGFNIPGM